MTETMTGTHRSGTSLAISRVRSRRMECVVPSRQYARIWPVGRRTRLLEVPASDQRPSLRTQEARVRRGHRSGGTSHRLHASRRVGRRAAHASRPSYLCLDRWRAIAWRRSDARDAAGTEGEAAPFGLVRSPVSFPPSSRLAKSSRSLCRRIRSYVK